MKMHVAAYTFELKNLRFIDTQPPSTGLRTLNKAAEFPPPISEQFLRFHKILQNLALGHLTIFLLSNQSQMFALLSDNLL